MAWAWEYLRSKVEGVLTFASQSGTWLMERPHRSTFQTSVLDSPLFHGPPQSAVIAPHLSPGQRLLDRFEVVSFLGRGGMGEVYRVEDHEINQIVAIKIMNRNLTDRPELLRQFRREIQLARKVQHRNVCQVFDVHRDESQREPIVFLTMEYLSGRTLQEILHQGPMPERQVIAVAQGLLYGLEAIHSAGIVHRDLKAGNIILVDGPDIRPVILDFGLSRGKDFVEHDSISLFGARAIVGTPAYMAPEQLRGEEVTPQADIYAFGVVLFQCLTGKLPFGGETPLAIALRKLKDSPPRVTDFQRTLDRKWDRIITACLDSNPRRRPISSAQLLHRFSDRKFFRSRTITRRVLIGIGVTSATAGLYLQKRIQSFHQTPSEAVVHWKRGEEFARRRTTENLNAAILEYQGALKIDPNYAAAWAGLADVYAAAAHYVLFDPKLARSKAEQAAQQALKLDPNLAKAHGALAYVRSIDFKRWPEAELLFRKAIRNYPQEPLIRAWFAAYLGRLGKHEEAILQARESVRIDPGSFYFNHQLAQEYYRARRFNDYLNQARELVSLQNFEAGGHLALARAYEWKLDFQSAEKELKQAEIYGPAELSQSYWGTLLSAEGKREKALRIANSLESIWSRKPFESNVLVSLFASLGDSERVFKVLEAGYAKDDSSVLAAATNPYLRPLLNVKKIRRFFEVIAFPIPKV